jgi:hypothetical protein
MGNTVPKKGVTNVPNKKPKVQYKKVNARPAKVQQNGGQTKRPARVKGI